MQRAQSERTAIHSGGKTGPQTPVLATLVSTIPKHAQFVLPLTSKSRHTSGDRIVVVVQKQRSDVTGASGGGSGSTGGPRVKRGDVRQAVVVRTRYASQRRDGSVARFGDNACVLVTKSGDPIGTRVNGVVGAELSRKKWSKILSMATMHV